MVIDINVKVKKAKDELIKFKEKEYECDVRFQNVHMKMINALIHFNLFTKNDLFISGKTLYELMQPLGGQDTHNYHGLNPLDILDALNNIIFPYCIFKTKHGRISIILSCLSHFGEPLMMIIEVGSGLMDDENANINKIVTMYPKSNIEKIINKLEPNELLYLNKLP